MCMLASDCAAAIAQRMQDMDAVELSAQGAAHVQAIPLLSSCMP